MALPPITFSPSAGPSQAQGAINPTSSIGGDIYFNSGKETGLVDKILPLVVIGGALWLLYRK